MADVRTSEVDEKIVSVHVGSFKICMLIHFQRTNNLEQDNFLETKNMNFEAG